MASGHVSRVPLHDSLGNYVLVNATFDGPAMGDLKLIATDGNHPYVTTVKDSRIPRLQAKNSPVKEAEWRIIVLATFLQQRVEYLDCEALVNLETSATINKGQLVIIFRKNISGITQRIGEISLQKDEDQEIDTIDWVLTAVKRADGLETKFVGLTVTNKEQAELIQKLNLKLEDLIHAKTEHENLLLEKFRELLNAKKLKVRDQQRLLALAEVDRGKATEKQAPNPNPLSATDPPSSSRPKKRKPSQNASALPSSPEDDDFESMDVDVKSLSSGLDHDDDGSPEKSDHDQASDEETSGEDDEL